MANRDDGLADPAAGREYAPGHDPEGRLDPSSGGAEGDPAAPDWFGDGVPPPPPPYAQGGGARPDQGDSYAWPHQSGAEGGSPAALWPEREPPPRHPEPAAAPQPKEPGHVEAASPEEPPEPQPLPPLGAPPASPPPPAPPGGNRYWLDPPEGAPSAAQDDTPPPPAAEAPGGPKPSVPDQRMTAVPPHESPPPYQRPSAAQGAPLPEPRYAEPDRPAPTADALRAEHLVRGRQERPESGWRRAVHAMTLGMVNPGQSPEEMRRRELIARIKTPVAGGHYRLAVLSLKGGVGKTTTTVALGSMLASLRGDRVLAVDANPDRGTLSDKVQLETAASIRDLLNEKHLIQRYADFRAYTSQSVSRLEVLASDRDPAVSEAFSEQDYREVVRILEHFYSICLTDCGTGLLHSAMAGVLGLADQIVLVSSPSVDGARSASATLDWLEAHQYGDLVHGGVVVLSMVDPKGRGAVDLDQLEEHFRRRCRAVVKIPWDTHLEEGAEIDLDRLSPATRDAYLELGANVGEAFAWPR